MVSPELTTTPEEEPRPPLTSEQKAAIDELKLYRELATFAEQVRGQLEVVQLRMINSGLVSINMETAEITVDSTRLDNDVMDSDAQTADLTVDKLVAAFAVHRAANTAMTGDAFISDQRRAIAQFVAPGQ